MDKIKPLFTATATAIGGRNGHTETSDGIVKTDLSLPREMGGPGKPGTATPEHLFAAGYAACFGGALDFVAKQKKRDAAKARITCAVTIGPREAGGFGLAVKMRVEDRSIAQTELAALGLRNAPVLDAHLHCEAETASFARADRHGAGDPGLGGVALLLLCHEVERTAEAGRITGSEQMLRRGRARLARAAHLPG